MKRRETVEENGFLGRLAAGGVILYPSSCLPLTSPFPPSFHCSHVKHLSNPTAFPVTESLVLYFSLSTFNTFIVDLFKPRLVQTGMGVGYMPVVLALGSQREIKSFRLAWDTQ